MGVPLKAMAPLLPTAFAGLDVGSPGVVVSSSSAFAHHVRTPVGTTHICYCHTPPPFLWSRRQYFEERGGRGRLAAPALAAVRRVDRAAAGRVDIFVANSRFTAQRLAANYGRVAIVIHPPIDTAAFSPTDERSGRFLVVARLRRYKSLDVAIEAATSLGLPLDVIGVGPDRARLQSRAGPTIRFHGRLSDGEVAAAMARCAALIVPGVEDFGMTTAEVQAAGRPPVAFAAGGALEIVRDGETGYLVAERTPQAVGAAMQRALREELDRDALVASARRFDRAGFDASLRELIQYATEREFVPTGDPVAGA
jgi:glycosyltransferase involved in cell wall biosynthesis